MLIIFWKILLSVRSENMFQIKGDTVIVELPINAHEKNLSDFREKFGYSFWPLKFKTVGIVSMSFIVTEI